MYTRPLIGPRFRITPPELKSSRGDRRAIPADLLREASNWLAVMSLIGAALWVLGPLLGHIALRAIDPSDPRWRTLQPTDGIAGLAVLGSLAMFAYARKGARDPKLILHLGLVYIVLGAAAVGLVSHLPPLPTSRAVAPVITWAGVLVLIFAAILPSAPTKTLVAGFLAASMTPLIMLVAKARGTWDFGPASNALVMHYPDYLLVGVAVVVSHVVTRLGRQVAKARDMGSYQLGELLGRGGMGEVYRATHRMLARPAAIKLMRPEVLGMLDGESAHLAAVRFRREAEAAARLRSPHTVEPYDFGVTDDETHYFVMELLDGMDLESMVRRYGPLPAGRVIHVVRQVCESLEEAHTASLVHRDIKPANIHLGRLGLRYDFAKVLDFGRSTDVPTCTHSGASPTTCSPARSSSRGGASSR
jgi:serine/threonine-protein kinase